MPDSPPDCRIQLFEPRHPQKKPSRLAGLFSGAGDEARTRYLHLGKVALYRMSYTRIGIGCQPSEPNLFDSSDSDLHGADRRNRISSIPTIRIYMVPTVGTESLRFQRFGSTWCRPSGPNLFDSNDSDLYGASGRNRTNDTRIFSPLLYLLSYRGIWRHAHCRSILGSWFIILWVFPFVNNFLQKSKGYADPPQSCGKFGMGAYCNSIAFIL